ncbi:uncharacterized protein LOC122050420 [Zingiber officinale]|nr:uncharacterized protein LOC122050420 [Zingiber officinale]
MMIHGMVLSLFHPILPSSFDDKSLMEAPYWLLLFSLFLSFFPFNTAALDIAILSATVRDRAFGVLARRRTGVAYSVPLPSDLSGASASVERIRSGILWTAGARLGSVSVPPRTTTAPFVRRLAFVYQDLGNRSSSFFDGVRGYALASPVVGLKAYDASLHPGEEVGLRTLGEPIMVAFPRVSLPAGVNSTAAIKCMRLGAADELADAVSGNACVARQTGHFALVVAAGPRQNGGRRWWMVWAVWFGGGVVVVVVAVVVGIMMVRWRRRKRRESMERVAEDEAALGTVWAGRSKMPSASMCRTGPVIEDATAP